MASPICHSSAADGDSAALRDVISDQQVEDFHRDGYVVVKDLFTAEEKQQIKQAVLEVQQWPFVKGEHMHYCENTPQGLRTTNRESYNNAASDKMQQLCRTENFLDHHPTLRKLFMNNGQGAAERAAAKLLGDAAGASVFKERINYKLPGGGGFAPHQDAPAWSGDVPTDPETRELSFMQQTLNMNVAVDRMFLQNGGLEVVRGGHAGYKIWPQNSDGTLRDDVVQQAEWTEVVCEPGDALLFSLHIPHRSGVNMTDQPRRAVYITYAGNSSVEEGARERYYAQYRKDFPPAGEQDGAESYEKGNKIYNWATPMSETQPTIWSAGVPEVA